MGHYHSQNGKVWEVTRLWALAKDLPVTERASASFPEWEGNSWGDETTLKEVAEHLERVVKADLRYPVILSAEGDIMDGCHRLVKAHMEGVPVKVVQFTLTPPPDNSTT